MYSEKVVFAGERWKGGYLTMKASHLNARLFNRLLAADGEAVYSGEQGKVLSALWSRHPQTATDLAIVTGIANSTLTTTLRRLQEQGLIEEVPGGSDRRKKHFDLTELGLSQQEVGDRVSRQLSDAFYAGFSADEVAQFEGMMGRVCHNLETCLEAVERG